MFDFDIEKLIWTRLPKEYSINKNKIEIVTSPNTDLWQNTYYHFKNDNAPVLQYATKEKFFSFIVNAQFESKTRFDQCGIVVYLDSENWLKASIEYHDNKSQLLGSVVTNNAFSDWATTEISSSIKEIWYRLSRRDDDFRIEYSFDGIEFKQMRICHLNKANNLINFGIYACSPENSSFKSIFTDFKITKCSWQAHDGQQPDKKI